MRTSRTLLSVLTLVFLLPGGCMSRWLGDSGTAYYKDAGRAYPVEMVKEPSLTIQVLRDVTTIGMTNTTAHAFGASTIWLNSRYSHEIDGMGVGQTLTLELDAFTDEFGEHFRGGGFFAIVNPDPLVMAEIESDGQLFGLVVAGDLYE
jgi:hypothetical protein